MNKSNCNAWLKKEICQHILNTNFPPLQYSTHFPSLRRCVELAEGCHTVLDIGCCKAEFSEAFPNLNYAGADLEHIIEGVSRVVRPHLDYVYFNAYDNDYSMIKKYDLIIMNSFLSELPDPLLVLENIVANAEKYIILHRQDISEVNELIEYQTYGGMKTTNSVIRFIDLVEILKKHKWSIKAIYKSFDENTEPMKHTMVIKNDNII